MDQVQGCMEILKTECAYFIQYRPAVASLSSGVIVQDEYFNCVRVDKDPEWTTTVLPKLIAFVEEMLEIRADFEKTRQEKVNHFLKTMDELDNHPHIDLAIERLVKEAEASEYDAGYRLRILQDMTERGIFTPASMDPRTTP